MERRWYRAGSNAYGITSTFSPGTPCLRTRRSRIIAEGTTIRAAWLLTRFSTASMARRFAPAGVEVDCVGVMAPDYDPCRAVQFRRQPGQAIWIEVVSVHDVDPAVA